MKLATIIPPSGFIVPEEGYHMVLGQWLLNRDYFRWYRHAHERGSFILVDNGAAEPEDERVPFDRILERALRIGADEIILPDIIGDGPATAKASSDAAAKYNTWLPPRKRMVVPQGRSWLSWLACLRAMQEDFAFRSIGIAKHLESLPGGRAAGLKILVEEGDVRDYDIHLLGVHDKDICSEIYSVRQVFDGIRGIDTGAPFAYAQHAEHITKGKDGVRRSLDNHLPADHWLVRENIEQVRSWCNDGMQSP